MNVSYQGVVYKVTTEADVICLCVALDTLGALARGKAA